jgi:hypothetical protein
MAASAKQKLSVEAYWSQQVFDCVQEMAQWQTNAVLLMLADVDVLAAEQHYPDDGLLFGNNRWRAFYHCHDAENRQTNEHGHFHIFTDTGDSQWAHVAGLSIDRDGQPLHWFAVNRWVTDGPWLTRSDFISVLNNSAECSGDELAGRWLYAMLQLYTAELDELFVQRDERVQQLANNGGSTQIHEDRTVYTLATKPVALKAQLETHLLN